MGFLTDLLKLCIGAGIIYFVGIQLRSKFIDKDEYYSFKKSDGLILVLALYICLFMTNMELGGLMRDYRFISYSLPERFIWLPFVYFGKGKDYAAFLNYVYTWPAAYGNTSVFDGLFYYLRLFAFVLPVAYVSYRVCGLRKIYGLIMTLALCGLIFLTGGMQNVGDGLFFAGAAFGVTALFGRLLRKSSIKWKVSIDYSLFAVLTLVTGLFVVQVSMHSFGQERVIGEAPLEKELVLGDGLMELKLDSVQWLKDSYGKTSVTFLGNFSFNRELFEVDFPLVPQDIHVTYKYAFDGNIQSFGTNGHDIGKDFFGFGLTFRDYSRENSKAVDFEFYGVSEVDVFLNGHEKEYNFEVIDEGFGDDGSYPYYEIVYKSDKFRGKDLNWIVRPIAYDQKGNELSFQNFAVTDEIESETSDTIVKSVKCYFYGTDPSEISKVEKNVYGGKIVFETSADTVLFSLEKEMFDN